MKRIIICCDGTWNTPDAKEHGASCQTNVAKLAELVSQIGADGKSHARFDEGGQGEICSLLYPEFPQ